MTRKKNGIALVVIIWVISCNILEQDRYIIIIHLLKVKIDKIRVHERLTKFSKEPLESVDIFIDFAYL